MNLVNVTLCEDIRVERDGRFTLVGVNSGVFVNPKKIAFPFGGFSIFAIFDSENIDEEKKTISVKLVCEKHNKEHFNHKGIAIVPDKFKRHYFLTMKLPFPPGFHEGTFKFFWSENDEDWYELVETFNLSED